MNLALDQNGARTLRGWLSESDRWLSPQAVILSPQATWEMAQAIVAQPSDYHRTVAAGQTAVRLLKGAVASGHLKLSKSETQWLHRIEEQLGNMPEVVFSPK